MTLTQFVRENREVLDKYIRSVVPNASRNDSERRQWVLNDERLYNWARSEGVKI